MIPRCPSDLEIARAVHDDHAGVAAHIDRCARCRSSRDGFEYAIVLARQLPLELPPDDELARMRAAVIANGSALAMSTCGESPRAPATAIPRRAPVGRVVALVLVLMIVALGALWLASHL